MHAAVWLWGFTAVLGRAITLEAIPLVWYRMGGSFLILGLLLRWRRVWIPVSRKAMGAMALIGGLMALHWVAFYASVKTANASVALICLATSSTFISFLEPLINRQRWKPLETGLSLVALGGVVIIYRTQPQWGMGLFLGLAAALIAALFTLLNKRIASDYPARTLVFYEMLSGWIILSFLIPLWYGSGPWPRWTPTLTDWAWIFVLVLFCTVWAQSLALEALKKISSFTSSLSVNLEPVYGILLAFVFYGENQDLDGGFYLGMTLILGAVFLHLAHYFLPRSRAKNR